jgi:hypothetical protein
VLQAAVPVLEGDSEATLAARVLAQEHRIYPQAIHWFCADRLEITPHGAVRIKSAHDAAGAPASSEQGPAERGAGPRLRDANVRESGAAPSSAGPASVSGVTSPKGAPVPPSDGALLAPALDP